MRNWWDFSEKPPPPAYCVSIWQVETVTDVLTRWWSPWLVSELLSQYLRCYENLLRQRFFQLGELCTLFPAVFKSPPSGRALATDHVISLCFTGCAVFSLLNLNIWFLPLWQQQSHSLLRVSLTAYIRSQKLTTQWQTVASPLIFWKRP